MDILEFRVKQAVKSLNGNDCWITSIVGNNVYVRMYNNKCLRVVCDINGTDKRKTRVIRIDGLGDAE